MNNPTRRFTAHFEGCWSPASEVFPIQNYEGVLVGGFTIIDGPVWKCFIASRGYGECLAIGTGARLWVTPDVDLRLGTQKLVLSLVKINEHSKEVNLEEEE